jgi:hypothetical protein
MSKIIFEEVKHLFEERGYKLLETEYINYKTKMRYICPKHLDKELSISYGNLRKGRGCWYCGREQSAVKQKTSFMEVRHIFDEYGYELLETEYKNCNQKLRYKCPKHPDKELTVTFNNLRNGHGCWYCGIEHSSEKQRKSFEEVKQLFEERGYELLEIECKNCEQKLRYKCPKHPCKELYISYRSLQLGQGCSYCGGSMKLTYNHIKQTFKENGYELLETEYINSRTKMRYICPKHPDKELYITYTNLYSGKGCPYCGNNAKKSFEEVKKLFGDRGYELLENQYINSLTKMKYKCPKHPNEILSITYANLYAKQGCYFCALELNKGENHWHWKGGLTKINIYLRNIIKDWKMDILRECNFTCAFTNIKHSDVKVHHLIPFHVVVKKSINQLNLPIAKQIKDYTGEELKQIYNNFINLHDNAIGIPLRRKIHELFHSLYTNNCTPEDFEEFKQRWDNGEFNFII